MVYTTYYNGATADNIIGFVLKLILKSNLTQKYAAGLENIQQPALTINNINTMLYQ